MAEDALFCVGQKAFVEKDGKVLVINDPEEGLDFPGGKIQEGEARDGNPSSLIKSLKREVREEVGLEVDVHEPFLVWYHEFPEHHRNAGKVVYLVGFRCTYVSGDIQLSHEHDRFKWVDRSNYTDVREDSDYFGALEKYLKQYHGA